MKKLLFKTTLLAIIFTLSMISCSKDDAITPVVEEPIIEEPITEEPITEEPIVEEPVVENFFIRGADMSFLPEAEGAGAIYKNNGVAEDALLTLKNAGVNTIRIRVWHTPSSGHSTLAEVKTLSQRVKQLGMKVWLTVHYSDTWADPGHQQKPAAWQGLSFPQLKAAFTTYNNLILTEIDPDIFQIGNEINPGFIFPEGNLNSNESQFLDLLNTASATIRNYNPDIKIMIHFAGINASDWFFNKVSAVDYDLIGLSYYPIWHGNNINALSNAIQTLGNTHQKQVIVAETSYAFTFGWNDWTNNIIGSQDQLLSQFPATPTGQKDYLLALKSLIKNTTKGNGFCYWGTEWISFHGDEAQNGSTWENQALWDFENNALPALEAFNADE
uniref:glycoside hydrolase family 53 protein n=2 Tax=Flavobacterium sp. TaxID=239 RepID=UPI0040499082